MGKCYRCSAETGKKASVLCRGCHAKAVAANHAHDTPSAEDLGLEGQSGDYGWQLVQGMRSCGRRVVRKSEPMAG